MTIFPLPEPVVLPSLETLDPFDIVSTLFEYLLLGHANVSIPDLHYATQHTAHCHLGKLFYVAPH